MIWYVLWNTVDIHSNRYDRYYPGTIRLEITNKYQRYVQLIYEQSSQYKLFYEPSLTNRCEGITHTCIMSKLDFICKKAFLQWIYDLTRFDRSRVTPPIHLLYSEFYLSHWITNLPFEFWRNTPLSCQSCILLGGPCRTAHRVWRKDSSCTCNTGLQTHRKLHMLLRSGRWWTIVTAQLLHGS